MKEKGFSAVLWWLAWIGLAIAAFFVSVFFWTPWIGRHAGPMHQPGVPLLWVAVVFGSWMLALIPLIIVMYAKVDKAYEDARLAREKAASNRSLPTTGFRSVWVDGSDRLLGIDLQKKLKKTRPVIPRGHLVTACLRDGRRVENVFVLDHSEILGIYGVERLDFKASDVRDVEPADPNTLPAFRAEGWLRLDGAGTRF